MKNLLIAIAAAVLTLTAFSCTNNQKTEQQPSAAPAPAQPDSSLTIEENIAWRAVQGMPITAVDIDTIVAYFEKADRWTAENLAGVKTKADFDSMEVKYTAQFPMMDIFSAILEDYASQISPEQMKRLQATAVSMGESVDKAAVRAGIEPESVNPLHDNPLTTDSI